MNATTYTVTCVRPGGMGCPRYEGDVTVVARSEEDAASKARRRFRTQGAFSDNETIRVTSVRREF